MVDCATSAVSGSQSFQACNRCVGSSSVHPIFIQYAYADDPTLLAVVRKLADRPAVAAFLNRDLARIQELCNHWCMILNPNAPYSPYYMHHIIFSCTKERNKEVQFSMARVSSLVSRICLIVLRLKLFIACTEWKKKVPFSMAIGNGELMHECFPKYLSIGTARMK